MIISYRTLGFLKVGEQSNTYLAEPATDWKTGHEAASITSKIAIYSLNVGVRAAPVSTAVTFRALGPSIS